jgi:methionine-rich copper-binding protein CopC
MLFHPLTGMRRRLTLFLLLYLFLAAVAPVSAHALLLHSTPQANAVLPQAPILVEMYFTETLEPSFSTASVFDSNGVRVDTGDVRVDPADTTRLFVSLRSLPDGVYTVSWKALSTVDGHVTTGAFPFAVGEVDAATLAAA